MKNSVVESKGVAWGHVGCCLVNAEGCHAGLSIVFDGVCGMPAEDVVTLLHFFEMRWCATDGLTAMPCAMPLTALF
ncbi:MAG: hypothetical protein IT497_05515 [Ottowia sp.]|nr:hypothetical protein [Ottowia sp.]